MKSAETERFNLSPLVRFTLLTLYLALVLPLPGLAQGNLKLVMASGSLLGLLFIIAVLGEQVEVSDEQLLVGYPSWCSWLLKHRWSVRWEDMQSLVPVGTSQGGKVFYIKTKQRNHHLLPQRIDRFDHFLQLLHERGGLDTHEVVRLTPAWTYQLLAGLSIVMLIGETVFSTSLFRS